MVHDPRPLVVHVVYRFDVGGLENGVVNLVNRMSGWRHAIVALTEVSDTFRTRIVRPDVRCVALGKAPGHGLKLWPSMVKTLRELRPDVVHTRNLAALEMQPAAWYAGVAARVHGEHGREANDIDGTVRKYQWIRRAASPFVNHWIALSSDLGDYLRDRVGIDASRVSQIYNGVDHLRFAPGSGRAAPAGMPFTDPRLVVLGTVGRMQTVKAQPLLVQAFIRAVERHGGLRSSLRLVLVGDGPLRAECERRIESAGLQDLAWFAGERADVPELLRSLDLFVLPSLAEGISNTILEAMACGLPVIATRVGGNADLVEPADAGQIVAPGDVVALADAIEAWSADPLRRRASGAAARADVERRFSLDAMVARYEAVYRKVSGLAGP